MALTALLFRCPACGADPLLAVRSGARCRSCGRSYEQGTEGTLRIREPDGRLVERPVAELAARAGEMWGADAPEGEARVRMREATEEVPVRQGRELLGFFERRGPVRPGLLRLDGEAVHFQPDGEEEARRWPLLELRAVQGSSSSVQISPKAGGVITFRFETDSPRRWEERLREAVRRSWARAGRGPVGEFQPRIRSGS